MKFRRSACAAARGAWSAAPDTLADNGRVPTTTVFHLPGMDCPAEEQLVRMALADVPGVRGWGST